MRVSNTNRVSLFQSLGKACIAIRSWKGIDFDVEPARVWSPTHWRNLSEQKLIDWEAFCVGRIIRLIEIKKPLNFPIASIVLRFNYEHDISEFH